MLPPRPPNRDGEPEACAPLPARAGHLTSRLADGSGEVLVARFSRAASRSSVPSSRSAWKSARARASSEWQW